MNVFVDSLQMHFGVSNLFGPGSVAGLTLTNRDEDGRANRVLAADTRLIFGGMYYVAAQFGVSTTDKQFDDVIEDRSGTIWEAEFDRTGRGWGFNYKLTSVGEDFETWSGFVNRTGIVSGRAFNRVSMYGARGDLLEQLTVFAGSQRIWETGNLFGSGAIEGSEELNVTTTLRGGWNINGRGSFGFVRFNPDDYASYQVQAPTSMQPFPLASGVFDAWSGRIGFNTPSWRTWDAGLSLQSGESAIFPEAAPANFVAVSGNINVRPSSLIRLGGSLTLQKLSRARDGSEFARTILPRLKVEVQPNRSLFFRVVGEYRSERQSAPVDPVDGLPIFRFGMPMQASATNRLRMDWLASYEPTPGSVVFLGYGSTLRGNRPLTFRELERTDDAFFMKVAYLFRW